MKTGLKILAALVSVAILWLGSRYVLNLRDFAVRCDTLTLTGDINSDTFVESRDCLVRSEASKKTFVVKASGGGDAYAALAIGILIHRHNWDVEVVGICPSSCANYIFPAGKTKYLNSQSMLLFHGGPHQKNIQENIKEMEEKLAHVLVVNGAPVDSVKIGHENKEATLTYNPNLSAADKEVLEFLSINKDLPPAEKWAQFTNASDQFYRELGINQLLPEYGQIGGYEPMYTSYKYDGFIYRLDSLRRFGIRNIELKDGEWHPERHPAYRDIYEVTYP
jgi:ATP-dependent protease ClpP protease subunit